MPDFCVEAFCSEQTNRFRDAIAKANKHLDPSDYELELICFRLARFGSKEKAEFCISLIRYQWPGQVLIEVGALQNHWLKRIIRVCCKYKTLMLMGAASASKTFGASIYAYNTWKSSPWNTSVYLSTTTVEAGEARIWGAIRDLHDKDRYKAGHRIDYRNMIVLQEDGKNKERDYRDSISAIAIKPGAEGRNAMGTISGRKNQNVIWCAQPLESNVLTPYGWVKNSDLQAGDEIIGSNGGTFHISHVHPVSTERVYRLTFTDGSKAESTGDHLWMFRRNISGWCKKKFLRTGRIRINSERNVTAPLSHFSKALTGTYSLPRWSLPRPEISSFNRNHTLPLSPYLVGALIGDGAMTSCHVCFYNSEADIVEQVRSELPEHCDMPCIRPEKIQHHIRGIYGPGKDRFNPVIRGLKELGLFGKGSENKFIPESYLFASVSDRISLLQGLMDTDGTVLKSTNRFTSISDQLRRDVLHLVRSLGGYARESLPYTVVFNLQGIQCFRSIRKLQRASQSQFEPRRRALVSVEEIGDKEVRCITTTAPDGLYVTDDFVLTHNCDELSAMDVGVLEARLNLLANPFSQFIGISNKPTEGDPMYIAAEPAGEKYPGGWTSVTPDDKGWTIKGGYCAYFDGEKSPNMGLPEGSGVPFPMLMTEEMRKNIEDASGGTDTIGYWTQVRGFPNSGEVQDTVLTTNLINAHKANEQPLWGTVKPECIAGLDLGFRKDGDPCVADFAKFGTSADGYRILAHEPDGITLRYSLNDKAPFEQQMADRFIDEAAKRDCHQVEVDVSGDGGIIAQQLVKRAAERDYKLQVHLCSFMGAPDENATFEIGGKRKPAKEIFDRKVSQLWYSYRLSVQNGVIRGLKFGSKAVTQLCQRKILMDEKKRWSVEPKKEMKLRIRRSPDEADSRCLCHSLAIRKGLTSSGMQPRKVIIPDFQDRVNPGRYSREQAGSSRYAGR